LETWGYNGTKSAFADYAEAPPRGAGRVDTEGEAVSTISTRRQARGNATMVAPQSAKADFVSL
jgi:hypothetical protein